LRRLHEKMQEDGGNRDGGLLTLRHLTYVRYVLVGHHLRVIRIVCILYVILVNKMADVFYLLAATTPCTSIWTY
jgi:hypothetical protein